MSLDIVKSNISAAIKVKQKILNDQKLMKKVVQLSEKCVDCLQNGGKIIFCGNGGSFADAQHLSAEFTSRFLLDRPSLASLALGTNNSAITAIANDYGYENIFSREIVSIANPIDIIIAITTSGNSLNILEVVNVVKAKNLHLTVFTGNSLGKLPSDINTINVPSNDTARIQECHILLGHIICGIVEKTLFDKIK